MMETTLARKIIESGGEVKTFTTPNSHSKIFGHFNPSILNDRGSLHVISRVCNYTLFHSELSDTIVEGRPLHYVGEDNSIFETTNHFT